MHSRKGFSLAELLVVVVITAVITSMIMISSRESASAANAGRIIDSLVNLSMAAMTLYSNSTDHFSKTPNTPADLKHYIAKYLNTKDSESKTDGYYIVNDSGTWWAGYKVDSAQNQRIEEKLTGRAKLIGLKGTDSETCPQKPYEDYDEHSFVWLMIRSSER